MVSLCAWAQLHRHRRQHARGQCAADAQHGVSVRVGAVASAQASACSRAVCFRRAAWCLCARGRSCIGTGVSMLAGSVLQTRSMVSLCAWAQLHRHRRQHARGQCASDAQHGFSVRVGAVAPAQASACSRAVCFRRAAWCICARGRSCTGTGVSMLAGSVLQTLSSACQTRSMVSLCAWAQLHRHRRQHARGQCAADAQHGVSVRVGAVASAQASACSRAVCCRRAAWCLCARGRSCTGTGVSMRMVPSSLLHLSKMDLSLSSRDGIKKNPRQIHYLQLQSCFVIYSEV
jgi:hypothetical protein